VKSSLNGLLPIRLSIGKDVVEFEVRKKGPGAKTLTARRNPIARFVAQRLQVRYIPSVRTAQSAMDVVDEMVSRKLREAEQGEEYQQALQAIEVLQKPVFDALSESIQTSLQQFLPQVGSVEIRSSQEARYSALRRYQIVVDDGTATDLKLKGDGVQSLAAISLIRHLSEELSGNRELILAVEEPEAHLHPKAIQEVRRVLADIAAKQQVVVTTHSPLLTNRLDVASNILVDRSRARPAKNIKQLGLDIREGS
jgi:predicted ATP-dependent endonuclease of OLD family